VHAGEIVGIAGISGNGQREFVAAITGERTLERAAAVTLAGVPVGNLDADARRARGMAYVPEERMGRGAVPAMTLSDNALLTAHRQGLVARGFIRRPATRSFAAAVIAAFGVKAAGTETAAESLSGGNLQKFIVGREIRQMPRVLIAAHPTWGVDVGAAAQIRQALVDLRDQGAGILVTSDDLDELFEICDRIAVMAQGRLSEALPAASTSAERVGMLMSGSGEPVAAAA
jgi:simple sugar transport system ATP-binding protein